MKAAAWAIEGLRILTKRGWRATCAASLFCRILKGFAPRGERILSNLALVYPESTEEWRRDLRRRVYEHLSWTVTEILALQRDPAQALEWVEEVHGWGIVEKIFSEGKGDLFVSGHYGNWELLAAWHAQRMAQKKFYDVHIVSQNTRDPDIARLISQYRQNAGIRLIPKTTSLIDFVKLLKTGIHLAVLADISWGSGIVLPFMGHPCTNTTGPATLATLASVPIVPVALYRKAPFRHVLEISPPLSVPEEKNRRLKMELLTREINNALEKMIAPRPELWFWLHNRWK